MGVGVDEAGGEHQIACVHLLVGAADDVATHLRDLPVADRHIALPQGAAAAVDDGGVAEDQLVRCRLPRAALRPPRRWSSPTTCR